MVHLGLNWLFESQGQVYGEVAVAWWHYFQVQGLERFQLLQLDLELAQHRLRKLCAVFEGNPQESGRVLDLGRVVEQKLLVEVGVLVLLHKVRHQAVELLRWALAV